MRLVRLTVALLAFAVPSLAQQSLPDPATYQPASDAEAVRLEKAWLHSGNFRCIAWAAELIAMDGRRELVPDLIGQLDISADDHSSNTALYAVLDALIQLRARVPAQRLTKLPAWCVVQKVILLATASDNRTLLMATLKEATDPLVWLAAANVLAEDPQPEFASLLLSAFHVVAQIVVVMPGEYGYGIGGGCGGSWGLGVTDPSWPDVNSYGLSLTKGNLFTAGVHPVRYYAFDPNTPRDGFDCSSLSKDQFIPGLLAEVARIPAVELRLTANLNQQIVYLGTDSYLANVRALLLSLNDDFQRLLSSYVRLGFLTSVEVSAMRLPVELSIEDRRTPTSPPLPPPPEFDYLDVRMSSK
jgi:hypothetical protein